MFDFLKNPWETDEQKRQKLNNSQTQTPFNGQQTPMTPRQMVEQAWDQSVAKQEAKEQAYKPMESMSTHDAVKYAWNKSLAEQEAKKNLNKMPFLRADKRNSIGNMCESYIQNTSNIKWNNSPLEQTLGAIKDYCHNYIDMRNANLQSSPQEQKIGKSTDNYYHCKANYEAAKRGPFGSATAAILGYGREIADAAHNYLGKGLTWNDTKKDFQNDLNVNRVGRQQAAQNIYNSAQEACAQFKPNKLNEEDEYQKWYR